jgi:MFS family permease
MQWIVLVLLVISVGINYIDRVNLSVAGQALAGELHLGPSQLGLLFSAFFWTYAGFMVLAGWFVERFNVIWVYALGYLLWSCATVFTGLANGFATLFALRLVLGMSESVAYPSYSKIIASGFQEGQRGIANGLVDAGSKLGPALGLVIGGTILAQFGWRMLFLSVGLVSLLWLIPWCIASPRIRTHELTKNADAPSFLEILSKRNAWGTFVGLFCGNYAWYFMLTWLPGYLQRERHYTTKMMALAGSLPFFAVAAGAVTGGWLADRLIRSGQPITRTRKLFVSSGLGICALILLPSALAADPVLAMVLLIMASFIYGFFSSNNWAITQTLGGPAGAGKWTGLQNCFGNFAGIAAPTITGFIVEKTGSFYFAFVWVCCILLVGAFSFLFVVGKVEQMSWKTRG